MLCCTDRPIMIDGFLAFVCTHNVPRTIRFEDGMYWLRDGKPLLFQDLIPAGGWHTDRFGLIGTFYTLPMGEDPCQDF